MSWLSNLFCSWFGIWCPKPIIPVPITPPVGGLVLFTGPWYIQYSTGMPSQMTKSDEGSYFDWVGDVHYITSPINARLNGTSLRFTYRIDTTGEPKFIANDGGSPSMVRLYLQRIGDTMTAAEPNKRWWSLGTPLEAGERTVEVPLTSNLWTGVFGQHSETGFKDTISNLQNIGFTFGAMSAGHGVVVKDGTVRFTLLRYEVV